jgi:hypothetical protein
MKFYTQSDYYNKPAFSGFLPGIAGVKGIPMWTFYVNRGQGICGFGVGSKDDSIAEYYSASKAYRMVSEQGFRTFIKFDHSSEIHEAFSSNNENSKTEFMVGADELRLREENTETGLEINVKYRTLANTPVAGLVREISIKNIGDKKKNFQLVDGLPVVVPAGVDYLGLKTMSTTIQAWMTANPVGKGMGLYRVGASTADTAEVQEITRSNFAFGIEVKNGVSIPLDLILDPDLLFRSQQHFDIPRVLKDKKISDLDFNSQIKEGKLPSGLFVKEVELDANESLTLVELYGSGNTEDDIFSFLGLFREATNRDSLEAAGKKITTDLLSVSNTETANSTFDEYCKINFLDNTLRGGFPYLEETENGPVYIPVYSRKHGDLERDYNWFVIPPEYYSQGWGNYRDVNQNRRSDIYFSPKLGTEIIREFVSFIQADGYNPLVVQGRSYTLREEDRSKINFEGLKNTKKLIEKGSYSPGKLFTSLEKDMDNSLPMFKKILGLSRVEFNGLHGEGFWVDHWIYNNDLIETYNSVFPDKISGLFWGERSYPYFTSGHKVYPRKDKWEVTSKGVRQYHSVSHLDKSKSDWVRDNNGNIYYATLGEKLIGLAAIKFITRDPFGMGVEMEAGKPGWYDALNGLPGLLGSSMPEVWELLRLVRTLKGIGLDTIQAENIEVSIEIASLLGNIEGILKASAFSDSDLNNRWHAMASIREEYRDKLEKDFSGKYVDFSVPRLKAILHGMEADLVTGIERAKKGNNGIFPTYFSIIPQNTQNITKVLEGKASADTLGFKCEYLPLFLEGFVHAFSVEENRENLREMHKQVMASDLYDKKIGMLKVNASLNNMSHEIGRARAFTPGWLENGSIWMHMQYKYLFGLLQGGLYKEFWELSRTMLVPFMDAEIYGRSPYENSSFIVSSSHPDESLHGRGFIARLSGSTAEFISIWLHCFFGARPYRYNNNSLEVVFEPCLPQDLFKNNTVKAVFMGKTNVTYKKKTNGDVFPDGNIKASKILLKETPESDFIEFLDGKIPEPYSLSLRNGEVSEIIVELE